MSTLLKGGFMRSTVLLDDALLDEAKELTGIHKTSPLLNRVLQDFVRRESAKRLALLQGSEKNLAMPPRRTF
jgi:Arc/MetJ family transcription regulator